MNELLVWFDTHKYSFGVFVLVLLILGFGLWLMSSKVKIPETPRPKRIYQNSLSRADLYLASSPVPKITFADVKKVAVYDDGIHIVFGVTPGCLTVLGPCDYLVAVGKPTECDLGESYTVQVYAYGVLLFSEFVFDFRGVEHKGFAGCLADGSDICVYLGADLTLIVT